MYINLVFSLFNYYIVPCVYYLDEANKTFKIHEKKTGAGD